MIRKVMFDCRSDADCLKWKHGMNLRGVEDLQLAQYVIENPDLEPANQLLPFQVRFWDNFLILTILQTTLIDLLIVGTSEKLHS